MQLASHSCDVFGGDDHGAKPAAARHLHGRVRQEFNPMAESILSMGISAGAERGTTDQVSAVCGDERHTAAPAMGSGSSNP